VASRPWVDQPTDLDTKPVNLDEPDGDEADGPVAGGDETTDATATPGTGTEDDDEDDDEDEPDYLDDDQGDDDEAAEPVDLDADERPAPKPKRNHSSRPKPRADPFSEKFYRRVSQITDHANALQIMMNSKEFAERADQLCHQHREFIVWAHELLGKLAERLDTNQQALL